MRNDTIDGLGSVNGSHGGSPPTMVLSDYLELTCNLISICIGIPVNIIAFYDVRRRMKEKYTRCTYLLLNLNISDLMVLTVYCVGKSVWIVTYEWLAGDLMCRLMRYLEAVSFSISSNIVILIACERLNSLRHPLSIFVSPWIRTGVSMAWLMAAVSMFPQLFFHQLYYPAEFQPPWGQCISSFLLQQSQSKLLWGKVYDIYHVCLLFYIPALILVISYALLLKSLQSILSGSSAVPRERDELHKSIAATVTHQHDTPISPDKRNSEAAAIVMVPLILHRVCNMAMMKRKRLKAIRRTLLLLTVYIVLWSPYNALSLWLTVDDASYRRHASGRFNFFEAIVPFNSVLNPFIYGRVIQTLKRWMGPKKTLKGHNTSALPVPARRSAMV